jgi:hypothetical protein
MRANKQWSTIGALSRGWANIELRCIGCSHVQTIPCYELARTVAPETTTLELGRRARCMRCGGRGAEVLVWVRTR